MYEHATPRQSAEYGDHWTPSEIAALLGDLDVRWCVVGGWALELAGVVPPRQHDDLEIAVPQFEFDRLRARLDAFEFFVVGHGCSWPAESAGGAYFDHPQTFIRDPMTGAWKADVIRSNYDGDTWVCQMERSIRRPYVDAVDATSSGIPYLRSELVLLYKGLAPRPKDHHDFRRAVGTLGVEARLWLAETLRVHAGPDHPWLDVLAQPG